MILKITWRLVTLTVTKFVYYHRPMITLLSILNDTTYWCQSLLCLNISCAYFMREHLFELKISYSIFMVEIMRTLTKGLPKHTFARKNDYSLWISLFVSCVSYQQISPWVIAGSDSSDVSSSYCTYNWLQC